MKVLIKQARIVHPSSPFNGTINDILVIDGKINRIASSIIETADQIIEHDNLHVSIGWIDLFANFADPGNEYRETIESGATAAASGGFTSVVVIPNTNPVVSSKTQVEYMLQKSSLLPIEIYH